MPEIPIIPGFDCYGGGSFNSFSGSRLSPSLDLQFAVDKSYTPLPGGSASITSRRGPAATFSRLGGGTRVNEQGLIEWAPENLLRQSDNISDITSWQRLIGSNVTSGVVDPFGGNRGFNVELLSSNGSRVEQAVVSNSVGVPHTFSFWARSETPTTIFVRFWTESLSPINLTSQWTRYVYTTTSINSQLNPQWHNGNTGAKNFQVYGPQFERSSTARPYIPTTTQPFYAPRFDHDPITRVCKGLLIEESSTNLLLRSEEPLTAPWSVSGVTQSGTMVSPSGGNAIRCLYSGGAAQIQANTGSSITGAFTVSLFMKRVNTDWVRIQTGQIGTNSWNYWFNLATGQIGGSLIGAGSLVTTISHTIQDYGNGWYRLIMVSNSSNLVPQGLGIISSAGNLTITRVDGAIYGIWGAQLEAKPFATSYIPTVDATATRAADNCDITGTNFSSFYNPIQDTASVGFFSNTLQGTRGVFSINDNTANERIESITNGNLSNVTIVDNGVSQVNMVNGTPSLSAMNEVTFSWKENNVTSGMRGWSPITDTSATLPTPNRLSLGRTQANDYLNGSISYFKFYKKSLPINKLGIITSPVPVTTIALNIGGVDTVLTLNISGTPTILTLQ